MLKIFFKISIANFITILKFPILLTLLLNSIISQMNIFILQMLQTKFLTRRSDVPLLIPISLHYSIYTRYQDIASDVEFPLVVKKWVLEVFLDYNASIR